MKHNAGANYTRVRGILNLAAKSAIRILSVEHTGSAKE